MSRVRRLKLVLWALTGLAAAVAAARFLFGLGATTNLSDAFPWGFWIGFDVMGGVALAAGGFVLTAAVYIFRLEGFHSLVRPAVLTALLGYLAVVAGLLFDLGLPWNIWHMIVFWNPHSPLFEVGWCVMLYLTVLTLEFFPVLAEDFSRLARVRRVLERARIPLVIAGIGLSTLHQSSLGSLFLITPYQLHPLWYSPLLPVLFLVSAIGLGTMMATFESHFTAWLYDRRPETGTLASLGGAARWILLFYAALRLSDLAVRGQLRWAWLAGWHSVLFWLELGLMALAPAALLFIPAVRASRAGQFTAAVIGVAGVVLNRIDVGGLAHAGRTGPWYLPSWTEIAASAGVVSAAALAFLFMVERFQVWEERPRDPEADPLQPPSLHPVGATWLGPPAVAGRTLYSLSFVLAAAVGLALLDPARAAGHGVQPAPVERARGGEVLWVDGNRDGYGTAFPHEAHQQREGGKASCVLCHHMNLPGDRHSGCYECHRDMYVASDAFRHDWHASPNGGRLSCRQCHRLGEPRSAASAQSCTACHKDLTPAGAVIKVRQYQAPGYADVMHRLCTPCHARRAEAVAKPDLARCATCHRERFVPPERRLAQTGEPGLVGKRLLLPPAEKR